jgi:uncharacterized secreted protein with C-terminal beta-propeller domain
MEKNESKFGVIAISAIVLMMLFFGLFLLNAPKPITQEEVPLGHFQTNSELAAYFQKAQSSGYGNYYRGLDIFGAPMMNAVADKAGVAETTGSGASATDYSKTNIQVEGVDEADIIKNDGKYAYAIAKGKLFIIEAFPAENAKIISQVDINDQLTPIEMFVSENKLMLFSNQNNYPNYYYASEEAKVNRASFSIAMPGRMPYYGGSSEVSVQLFDITDKANPALEKEISFQGNYLTSRLIGKNAYFVINSQPRYYAYEGTTDSNDIIPMMRVNGVESKVASVSEIGIMPRVLPQSFVTIASLNLDSQELTKETVAATAQNVYASESNLYFVENYWESTDYNGPIPLEMGMLVKSMYFPNIGSTQKTVINKFNLVEGKAIFVGQGMVPGNILNQFSMDEFNDNFRIATTVENYSSMMEEVGGAPTTRSTNNVYVLDKDMKLVGSLEGIAPDESIYSVRFMGNKGYMVTFKHVDPLFVIDLSDATNPKILGKLKIPGYSDYLHPIDETHLLGIGKDANELEDAEKVHSQGAVYYTAIKGVKMAIFDVSDVANPIELSNYIIGDRGTDSEALSNHKAILFDKEKQLLVLPITIVENKTGTVDYYGQEQSFQGAIVMNVSIENGFSERGKITHVSAEEELKRGYYYGSDSVVRRSLFMDNVLYTFSDKMLKASNLDTLENISEVIFPQTQSQVGGVPPETVTIVE